MKMKKELALHLSICLTVGDEHGDKPKISANQTLID